MRRPLILLAVLLIAAPAGANQLVSASLKNGDYGTGTAVAPTNGVVNTADGVLFIATETSGRSKGLVNWQIGNNFQWRRTGTITFMFKAIRGQFAAGSILGDNYGFGKFNNGQGTFGVGASPVANGPGPEDDRVQVGWSTWHNNVWYNHATTQLEYDRWYSIGFAWGGPSEFEIWVDQQLKSAVNLAAAGFPWGSDGLQSGFNMGIGDNHERGVDPYNSAAGVMFADIRMWNEHRAFGDTVSPNRPPVTADDEYSTNQGVTLAVSAPGVLDNDTDEDGDALTAALAAGVANGTLTLNADGSFIFQPNAGFYGTDSFTYEASDGAAARAGTVAITVLQVNEPPVASADAASALDGVAIDIDVVANDYDADGDPLTLTGAGGAALGTLALAGNQVRYRADILGGLAASVAGLGGLSHGGRTAVAMQLRNAQRALVHGHASVARRMLQQVANLLDHYARHYPAAAGLAATIRRLASGTLTDQFSYTISDGQGGTASATVTVTIGLP